MRDLLWNAFACVKAQKGPGGNGPGEGEIKIRSCYTGSSIMSSKMRKRRHLRKCQTMISSLMPKTTLWPSLTLRRTNVHQDSCSLTIAHTLLPEDHCSLLSLGRCRQMALTVMWRSTDRLISPMRTYCVLDYL